VHWYTKAANQGHARAQNCLGDCYNQGAGVTKDPSKSFYWYNRSANQGIMKALRTLQSLFCKAMPHIFLSTTEQKNLIRGGAPSSPFAPISLKVLITDLCWNFGLTAGAHWFCDNYAQLSDLLNGINVQQHLSDIPVSPCITTIRIPGGVN
jgi:TPR repeat protein